MDQERLKDVGAKVAEITALGAQHVAGEGASYREQYEAAVAICDRVRGYLEVYREEVVEPFERGEELSREQVVEALRNAGNQ
jgi:hypothetical protein